MEAAPRQGGHLPFPAFTGLVVPEEGRRPGGVGDGEGGQGNTHGCSWGDLPGSKHPAPSGCPVGTKTHWGTKWQPGKEGGKAWGSLVCAGEG